MSSWKPVFSKLDTLANTSFFALFFPLHKRTTLTKEAVYILPGDNTDSIIINGLW